MRNSLKMIGVALLSASLALLVQQQFQRQIPASIPQVTTRPIAEFEKTYAIALSEQLLLRETGISLLHAIISAGAKVYLFQSDEMRQETESRLQEVSRQSQVDWSQVTKIQIEHESFWLRDFLPLPLLKQYHKLPPTPSFMDFVYRDGKSFDDAAMHQFALAIDSSIEHLPIVMDGGNFMTDGEICVISDEFKSDQKTSRMPTQTTSSELVSTINQALGCRRTIAVSQVPHPHVDMWIKFVAKGQVIINEIDDVTLGRINSLESDDIQRVKNIKIALDEVARQLSAFVTVTRIPMPLPKQTNFLTYANSLIVNDKVIVPRYSPLPHKKGDEEQPDADLYADYEQRVTTAFKKFGLQTIFLDADQLIREGGAFHCVSFHLNDLEAIRSKHEI